MRGRRCPRRRKGDVRHDSAVPRYDGDPGSALCSGLVVARGGQAPRARGDVGRRGGMAEGRYRIVPEKSLMWAEAKSSLHPIRAESRAIVGYLDAEIHNGRLDM